MASDVLSLFGMDPNVLQQRRVQSAVDQAGRMSADYAIGSAGGQMLGAGVNSAFGLQTPDMAQASSIREGLAGGDLGSVEGLRAAARKLMLNGDYAQAMALHQEANNLERLSVKTVNVEGIKTYQLPDGTLVQGAVVNGVPSYRKGGQWVSLPDDALIYKEDKKPANITRGDIDAALVAMQANGWLDTLGGLSRKDKLSASDWVAARTKVHELTMHPNAALELAIQEGAVHLSGSGTTFNGYSWNSPDTQETSESTPEAVPTPEAVSTPEAETADTTPTNETSLPPRDAIANEVVQQLTAQVAPNGVENLSMADRITLEDEALKRIMEEADVTRKQARKLYHRAITGKAREYQVITTGTGEQFLVDPTGFDKQVYPYTGK